ncbi:hypothetical protein APASM_0625 [Actinosynnema pretiosum subsp. pretiosum]|nr:hypothetical protein APASM_0625 [Actinosynnema pretiosum subsp. pretiosum]
MTGGKPGGKRGQTPALDEAPGVGAPIQGTTDGRQRAGPRRTGGSAAPSPAGVVHILAGIIPE